MRRIYILLLLILACCPMMLHAENETSYLPLIGIRKVYLRAQRLESVELPPFHNDSAQVIIRHSSKGQHYDYAATVPYERWMLDGRIKIREEVHGCVNCDKGKAEQSLWAGILPAYVPDYKLDSIAPKPAPPGCSSGRTVIIYCPDSRTTVPNWTPFPTPSSW